MHRLRAPVTTGLHSRAQELHTAIAHCLLGSSLGTSAKQTGHTLLMLSHLVTQLAWYTCLQGSAICRSPLLYSIWQITHLSRRVFFLEKKPHLYFVTGSDEMRSWERPRLWVPTASPKSNNSSYVMLSGSTLSCQTTCGLLEFWCTGC